MRQHPQMRKRRGCKISGVTNLRFRLRTTRVPIAPTLHKTAMIGTKPVQWRLRPAATRTMHKPTILTAGARDNRLLRLDTDGIKGEIGAIERSGNDAYG
jgi:hypothetical protein